MKTHLIAKVTAAGLLFALASRPGRPHHRRGREVSARCPWCLALTRHRESMAREMVRVTKPGGPLQALFEHVGLKLVTVRAIDIPTVFQDFEDYWNQFLSRPGAAPSYLALMGEEVQERIRQYLKSRLGSTRGGPIELTARALGVHGFVPAHRGRVAD